MNLKDMLNSTYGRAVIAAILGLGLSTLFRKSCSDGDCIKFKAPDLEKVEGKTYRHNGECYQFIPSSGTCSKGRKTIRFA